MCIGQGYSISCAYEENLAHEGAKCCYEMSPNPAPLGNVLTDQKRNPFICDFLG